MEHLTYEGNNQRKIERFLLLIYTVYSPNMILVSVKQDWDSWVGFLLIGMLAGCWIVYVSKLKNYAYRAKLTAVMMQGSMVLYAIQLNDLPGVLPVFMAFAVFMGMFQIRLVDRDKV